MKAIFIGKMHKTRFICLTEYHLEGYDGTIDCDRMFKAFEGDTVKVTIETLESPKVELKELVAVVA